MPATDSLTVDAIITALYATISGPPGGRDWDRLRALFHPQARLAPIKTVDGSTGPRVLDIEQFIAQAGPHLQTNGFFESEVWRRVETFEHVTHVFSRYQSRHTADGEPFARGVNSIQLVNDGIRFWVYSLLWDEDPPG